MQLQDTAIALQPINFTKYFIQFCLYYYYYHLFVFISCNYIHALFYVLTNKEDRCILKIKVAEKWLLAICTSYL